MFGGSNTDPRKVFGCLGTKKSSQQFGFSSGHLWEKPHEEWSKPWLVGLYRGWNTTHLYDMGIINYNKPLQGSLLNNQYFMESRGFFSCLKWPFFPNDLAAATQRSQADERTKADERCFGVCFFWGIYKPIGSMYGMIYLHLVDFLWYPCRQIYQSHGWYGYNISNGSTGGWVYQENHTTTRILGWGPWKGLLLETTRVSMEVSN